MNNKSILAWHFSTGELDFDMRGTQVVAGLKVSIDDMPHLGYKGFHGCIRPLDALDYFVQRPNPDMHIFVSRVVLSGRRDISGGNIRESKNIASETREHLWIADAKVTVEEFGIWCYMESSRTLRENNHEIAQVFDNALKARLHKDDKLPELAKSVRDMVAASDVPKRLFGRLAVAITMNTIDFALSSAHTLVNVRTNNYLDFGFDTDSIPPELPNDVHDTHSNAVKSSNEKLHDMLMQLAPEGYTEP